MVLLMTEIGMTKCKREFEMKEMKEMNAFPTTLLGEVLGYVGIGSVRLVCKRWLRCEIVVLEVAFKDVKMDTIEKMMNGICWRKVEHLRMRMCHVEVKMLERFGENLRSLDLTNCGGDLSRDSFVVIGKMMKLERLCLGGIGMGTGWAIDDKDIEALGECEGRLEELDVTQCRKLTGKGMDRLGRGVGGLKVLLMFGCEKCVGEEIGKIGGLRRLEMDCSNVEDKSFLKKLGELQNVNLWGINLYDLGGLDKLEIVTLFRGKVKGKRRDVRLPILQKLSLKRCDVDAEGWKFIGGKVKKLDLFGCEGAANALEKLVRDGGDGLRECCVISFGALHGVPKEVILNGFMRIENQRGLWFEKVNLPNLILLDS